MAAKKQTKSKTRTTAKKQGFQFHWWMAAALVAVVALVGVLVLRFSKASTSPWVPSNTLASEDGCATSVYGIPLETLSVGSKTNLPGGRGCVIFFLHLANGYQLGKNFKVNYNLWDGWNGSNSSYTYTQTDANWVKFFQRSNGLSQDGIVGPATWGALIKACYIDKVCAIVNAPNG